MARTKPKSRDRKTTEAKLVAAVGTVLARDGFHALNASSVAREASVDKALIYRYFGSLDGIVDAYARSCDFWPSFDELTEGDEAAFRRLPPVERAVRYFRNLSRAIRTRPLTLEILAWETLVNNVVTRQMNAARLRLAGPSWDLFADVRDKIPPAMPSLIIAAMQYVAMRSRIAPNFAGTPIQGDAAWRQIEEAQEAMIRGAMHLAGLENE